MVSKRLCAVSRQHQYEPVAFVHIEVPFSHRWRRAEDHQLFSQTCDVIEYVGIADDRLVLSQQRIGLEYLPPRR